MLRKVFSLNFSRSMMSARNFSAREWNIQMSEFAAKTLNPIRIMWERHQPKGNKNKEAIYLQPGDPTLSGHFPPHKVVKEALHEAVENEKFSYGETRGNLKAREAIAEYCKHMGNPTAEDVFITNGGSMAFEVALRALVNPGENVLVPRPAWSYVTWINAAGVEAKFYDLDPDKDWDVKLDHLESQIDEKTRAIICNSPGNPCGNVLSKELILSIIDIAERHRLPIISDEIYEYFTFSGITHYSFAELSKNVPILVLSGLTKRFLIPSVRLDWIVMCDRGDKLGEIRKGIANLGGRNFYPNSTIQFALPRILKEIPEEFFEENNKKVYKNAKIFYDRLKNVPGLRPIMPRGAIYMFLGIDTEKFEGIETTIDFMRKLAEEESVFCLPSECFNYPGFLRIVISSSEEILAEAANRIAEFSERHCKK